MGRSKEVTYEVESIVSKKKIKGKVWYEVKWKGYSTAENTLEPANIL